MQLVPQCQYKKYKFEKFVNIADREETIQAFPVVVSTVTELSFLIESVYARIWKNALLTLLNDLHALKQSSATVHNFLKEWIFLDMYINPNSARIENDEPLQTVYSQAGLGSKLSK